MSIFAVNYLCREVLRDHTFRAAMKADPAKALAPLELTDEERRCLLAGDVGHPLRIIDVHLAAERLDVRPTGGEDIRRVIALLGVRRSR